MIGPLPDGLGDTVGEFISASSQIVGVVAEEHRRSGGPDDTRAMRGIECIQQRQPVTACLGGEHVGVTGIDGWDPGLSQGVETHAGISALLDDHGDIAGLDAVAVEGRRAGQ